MVHKILFLVVMALCCGPALVRGGWSERWGAILVIAGTLITIPATWIDPKWTSPQFTILAIDLMMLAAFLLLALKSDRFWPLWATGFHLVGVTTHFARMAAPEIVPNAYAHTAAFWGYPTMLALAVGTMMPRRGERASIAS